MARKKPPAETKVESIRHKDERTNIPTEELRDFIADDEQAPKTMLYPRDPSLDPQLVWRGKDEQDRQDLAVPVVPIYIQEKIHPQAIIDDLMAQPEIEAGRAAVESLQRFQRHRRLRQEDRLLPPCPALVEPDDPRRLAARDDQPGREGGSKREGPDDLFRPALWHQVRVELAGEHA